jgi:hypothetical protein
MTRTLTRTQFLGGALAACLLPLAPALAQAPTSAAMAMYEGEDRMQKLIDGAKKEAR